MVVLLDFRKRGKQLKTIDLGELAGPLLVFGGVYSNLQSFQALADVIKARKILASNVICTGDIVAYCADPDASINAVRASGCAVLMGNCEQQLAENADDCGCGFDEGTMCRYLSVEWYRHANETVSKANRKWLATLPERLIFEHCGKHYIVVHGGTSDIAKFIWSVDDKSVFERELDGITADVVLAGHSGIAFQKNLGGKNWINAGAIGMPPHDGSAQTRYVIIKDGNAEIHSLSYDHYWASTQMQAVGLLGGYHTSLISGYWPSEDMLPKQLCR